MKGLVGGAAQGSAECRRNWTAALILRSLGIGTHPTSVERADGARRAWGGDDDEWIRSLTEAQEATTDIPEDGVTYDYQDADPEKVRPIQMGEFLRKYILWRLLALSEGEIAAVTTSMRQVGVGSPGQPWPSISSSTMSAAWPSVWWQLRHEEALLRSKRLAPFPGLA